MRVRKRLMKSFFIIIIVFILTMLVSFDAVFPQAGKKETVRIGEESPSRKKPAGTPERNPFLLPSGIHLLSKGGGGPVQRGKPKEPGTQLEESELPPFSVRAILISDQIRLATIGSYIVTVGDKIDGETIFEIKSDRVILGKGDRKRTLHLRQSPVQLTVEEKQ